ncbi:hypothetical protein E2C01_051237 [Portunus trituberculatus]|uniref:Uncharacterized protein n=1 Tax=Portunus trituberculatus TaxID=210409 RepID=A0A5B7GI64_PORTR|nr:hypothetical protein [Portunus trituberculatus]
MKESYTPHLLPLAPPLPPAAAASVTPAAHNSSPPTRKQLPRVRRPNLHLDRGQDSNPWRPLGPQSTHGSTVPHPSKT